MSRERRFRDRLLEIYKELNIRRGLSESDVNRLMKECEYVENNLSEEQIHNIVTRVINYLIQEEPDNNWGRK